MSVRPVNWDAANQRFSIQFDELGHSGDVSLASITWAKNLDGSNNHRFLVINCPDNCGSQSVHPVGGGSAPREVQELFVRVARANGCACGLLPAGRPFALVIAHMRTHAEQLDFPGRWQAPGNIS
jgi:hypothetical protein